MSKLFAHLAKVAAGAQRARTVQQVLETAGVGLWQAGLRLSVVQITAMAAIVRYVCDPDGELAWVEAALGRPLLGMVGPVDPNGPARHVLSQGRAVYFDDLASTGVAFLKHIGDLDTEAAREMLVAQGFCKGILLPVMVRGAGWGTLLVCSQDLSTEDGGALALFGAQLGSAIETADSIETLERRTRELAAIHSVATSSSSEGIDRLATQLLHIAAQTTDSDYGVIYVLDESNDKLVRVGSPYGYTDSALAARYETLSTATQSGHTALTLQPAAVSVTTLPPPIGDDLASHGFQELCLAPLTLHGRPAGTLNLVRARPRPYTAEEVRFAEILAGQIAIQLENARLYAEEKLRVAELSASYERLERTQQELVRHEKLAALGELAAAMAHELRNPLGAIFNSLGALRKITPKPSEAELFEKIIAEEAERVNRIVGDLLDFARPYKALLHAVSMRSIVASVLEATAVIADDAGVEVHAAVPAELPEVWLDSRMLRQALINLVVNGIQASPRGGRVGVSVAIEDTNGTAMVRIDVSDDGSGVHPDARGRIFEPFFTTKPTGTGLGLAVVKRIVEAHQGCVELRSNDTRGATLRVSVPARLDGA